MANEIAEACAQQAGFVFIYVTPEPKGPAHRGGGGQVQQP